MDENFVIAARQKQFLPFFTEEEKHWEEPFYFIQAADTQFGMQEKYVEKKQEYGWSKEIEWSTQMIKEVNNMWPRPKFMVICGDLLDAWPTTEQEIRDEQEKDFKALFSQLEVPLVCVCGNHDIGNQPTYSTVSKYRSSFGDDYFSFWAGGTFFIVLNTQYYEDSSLVPELAEEQDKWLEEQLEIVRTEKPKHSVVLQHIPFFLENPDEPKEYFNFDIAQRQELLDRIYDAGVRYVFCGHYHRNAGGFYKDLEEIVTSAVGAQLGGEEQGFRIVKVLEDKLEHRYYRLGTAPKIVDLPSTSISLPFVPTSEEDYVRNGYLLDPQDCCLPSWSQCAHRSPKLGRGPLAQ